MPDAFPEFTELTVAQRLDLITQLWDSIPDSVEAMPVPEWHRQEVERRLDVANGASETGIPWERVRRRLHGQ